MTTPSIILAEGVENVWQVALIGADPLVPAIVFSTANYKDYVCTISNGKGVSANVAVTIVNSTTLLCTLDYTAATFGNIVGTYSQVQPNPACACDIVATNKTTGKPARLAAYVVQFSPTASQPVVS